MEGKHQDRDTVDLPRKGAFRHFQPSPRPTVGKKNVNSAETYSVPGGSSRQLGLLQQHHVLHATLGQVVGDAGANASSADDDRVRRVLPPLPQG